MPHQVVLAAADGSCAAIDMHKAFVAGTFSRGNLSTGQSAVIARW
jgi:hypothetical protein